MRTTVSFDDTLYQQALAFMSPEQDKSELFREAVRTFIRVRSAERLAALGGAASDMADVPRGRGAQVPPTHSAKRQAS